MRRTGKKRSAPWVRRRRRVVIVLLVVALCLSPWLVWRLHLKTQAADSLQQLRTMGVPTTEAEREAWLNTFPAREGISQYADAAAAYVMLPMDAMATFPTFRSQNDEQDLFTVPYPEATLNAMREVVALNTTALGHIRAATELPPGDYNAGQGALDELVGLICADACVRASEGDGAGAAEAIRGGLLYLERTSPVYATSPAWFAQDLDRLLVALFSSAGQAAVPTEALVSIRSHLNPADWEAELRARLLDGMSGWLQMIEEIDARPGLRLMDIVFGFFDRQRLMECQTWAFRNELIGKSIAEQQAAIDAVRHEPWGGRVRVLTPPLRLDVARTVLDVLRFHRDQGAFPTTLEALVPTYCDAVPMNPVTGTPLVYAIDGTTARVSGSEDEESGRRRPRRNDVTYRVQVPNS